MFNWLKKLFGFDTPDTPVIAQQPVKEAPKSTVGKVTEVKSEIPAPKAEKAKASSKPKTKPKAKKATSDLDSMTKKDLLAMAKEKGVKANASLSKTELIKRLS